MSFPALLYTAAAVAFFIMMINRPVVEPPNTDGTQPGNSGQQLQISAVSTAAGETDSADATEDSSNQAEQSDSTAQTDSNDSGAAADGTAQQQEASDGDSGSNETDAETDAGGNASASQAPAVTSQETSAAATTATAAAATQVAQASGSDDNNGTATAQTATGTPDYARERRIGNEIRDAILEGDIFYLNDGSRNFMSIQTDADERRGGALILHGRGFHPDWEDAINPLRTGLAENGWTTLSLQMPVLEKDAKYNDYVPLFAEAGQRIEAGIRHLKQQGISPITIVAHSCGAHMAMQWVRDNGDADIAAYVGLGMGATDLGQTMAEPFPLDTMTVPVFDVYGESDFPAVIKMAPGRWEQMKTAGNPASAQRMLPEADHYFTDKGDELVGTVSEWLNGLQL